MKKIIVALAMLLFAVPVFGTTYTWVDEQGTVNFSDDMGSIPKKFRKKAKVLGAEEEEQAPAAEQDRQDKPKEQVRQGAAGEEVKPAAPVVSQEKKGAEFGGKAGPDWKNEFGKVNADLKAAEEQLVQLRSRLGNTSGMSRVEYLSIQTTIRNSESRVLELRKRRDDLAGAADRANVPAEYR